MLIVCRHVNLLIKKVSREELLGADAFDFATAPGKWLQGFQFALADGPDLHAEDLQFTQLLCRGTHGDVIADYIPAAATGGSGLDQALEAEDFGFEKGSAPDIARRLLLCSMLLNMDCENVFGEEYYGIAGFHLDRTPRDVIVREECPGRSPLHLSGEFGRKKLDYDTFIGFELRYSCTDADGSVITEATVPDPNDFSDEPERITVPCIAHAFLEEITHESGRDLEKLDRAGFGVCRCRKG